MEGLSIFDPHIDPPACCRQCDALLPGIEIKMGATVDHDRPHRFSLGMPQTEDQAPGVLRVGGSISASMRPSATDETIE